MISPSAEESWRLSDPKKKEVPSSSFHHISPGKVTIYLMWTELFFGKGSCALGCPGCRGAAELNPRGAENGSWDLRCEMRGQRMAVWATARSLSPGSGPGPTLSLLWGPLFRSEKKKWESSSLPGTRKRQLGANGRWWRAVRHQFLLGAKRTEVFFV